LAYEIIAISIRPMSNSVESSAAARLMRSQTVECISATGLDELALHTEATCAGGFGPGGGRNRRIIFSDSRPCDLVVPSILTTYRLVGTLRA
jgi:hypothetical protein